MTNQNLLRTIVLFFGKYTISENGKKKIVPFEQKIFDNRNYKSCHKLETIKQFIIIYVYFLKIERNPLRFIYLWP